MNIAVPFPSLDHRQRASFQGAPIRLLGVTKTFGGNQVLRGIDLEIEPGQFVAIVGRSGCGKSTLLRLLAELDRPTSGTVLIDGQDTGWREKVRLMFQEPRLLPWQRVGANVEIGLAHTRQGADRRRHAADAIAHVGLSGREGDWPAVLSGGQKQRIALARALVSHPSVLALDEPLGALDALTRIEMQALIERVWLDQGFTVVVVTHDVAEAVFLADRVVLLDAGRVALDIEVNLPRPRRHGDPAAAVIERRILERLLLV